MPIETDDELLRRVSDEELKWNARKGSTAEERIRYWAWDGNPPPRLWWRRLLVWARGY